MGVILITGSAGLIGSEAVRFFSKHGTVVGVDNDMRRVFFGPDASTDPMRASLEQAIKGYIHHAIDIRDAGALSRVFDMYGSDITLVIHTAAQPSHDWAATDPQTDFSVNANGTLNLLECTRKYCPEAVFIFCSTNKVYGDTPNRLPLIEGEKRYEVDPSHPFAQGIDETMSIDNCLHSIFGVSKVAADLMVQEYGRYFNIKTAVFRGGCLTGRGHAGAMLHGFLSYLMKCAVQGVTYKIMGYKGKQVRDNIHSYDLVNCFYHFYRNPRVAAVYNIGGGVHSNCSIIEAIEMCEKITGRKMLTEYIDRNRIGDHIWYVSDVRKFQRDYPEWKYTYSLQDILTDIYNGMAG